MGDRRAGDESREGWKKKEEAAGLIRRKEYDYGERKEGARIPR